MLGSLLNADDDWQEGLRRYWYPKLHGIATLLGGYSTANVGRKQYVGYVEIDEEVLEIILVDLGFERNPIAALKIDPDGNTSDGSWVLRSHDDEYDVLERDRQLHVTLFQCNEHVKLYAHNEYDWQDQPVAHLNAEDFKPTKGRNDVRRILDKNTFLDVTYTYPETGSEGRTDE